MVQEITFISLFDYSSNRMLMCLPVPTITRCLTNLTTSALLADSPMFKKPELLKRIDIKAMRVSFLASNTQIGTITSQGPTKLCVHSKPKQYSGKIKQQKEMNLYLRRSCISGPGYRNSITLERPATENVLRQSTNRPKLTPNLGRPCALY